MTERDDRVAAHLLQRHAPAPEGPCPPDDLLAGFAEGRVGGERATRVAEHLTRCDGCRAVVSDLRSDRVETAVGESERPLPSLSRERWRRATWAIAASVLLAVGAAAWMVSSRSSSAGLEERLVAESSRLSAERPDLLGGFRPLSRDELAAAAADAPRGGLSIVVPAETVLPSSRSVEWSHGAAGTRYSVALAGPDGTVTWSADDLPGRSVAIPPAVSLSPGRTYVVEVTGRGALGVTTARRSFHVASEEVSRRWEETRREVEARADAGVRSLLLAHAAARGGLYVEAERFAREQVERTPEDAFARETLASVRRVLGRPDEGAAHR